MRRMNEFHSTLLREKFVITDAMPGDMDDKAPIIALSNRLTLPLSDGPLGADEKFVLRAQNMHTTLRLAAQAARSFQEEGPLMGRKHPFDWPLSYLEITKGYERKWNPGRWASVYHKGRVVFEDGEATRHPFLDIVEQCDARNPGDYEKAMEIAKDAFRQAGKLVNIEHEANVALIMNIAPDEGKCGVILRGPNRTTTFNFTARRKAGRDVKVSQCLTVSAAFLEGIQLAFLIGMTNKKLEYDLIDPASDEVRKSREASEKIGRLNNAVAQFENLLDVTYRPDRPNFAAMIDEAEDFARKLLLKDIMMNADRDGKSDWIV